ncbi:MAG: hypothetical protein CO183_00850 [Candidatus Zambryskibacteria bacterium CG_4_9_14_3_um_filter_42_9]|uniref:SCP domain-containing protein n=1 Tax=Candidatus Zambryskibacteria bacterium CG22_combo_CG10-13_8_21_14_all_42_17 TaxID=1975118 RepID=A0A2H0BD12_9BACT|nr:MAG: hypothetical protein COX06_02835 [Candidatus Zambryskibacteria bacterium CG22_combo_CG10-13_8_21_14_all_42_17]PJA36932.1 MAG: hypothetical protein CO183_00850 [Candidatus Zambryskibacteria bacterium CG_4_9_14_3_um_filter_42_9]
MRKRLKNHFVPSEENDYKPHFVRAKNLLALAMVAVALFFLAFSVKSVVTRHPDLLSAVITSVLVDLTNSNRLAQNVVPLSFNATLTVAAQLKADDMASKGYFAHNSPDGRTPWYWFGEAGYNFIYAGENLAVNFVDSEDVVRAWMNSEGHRVNILNGRFTEIGIAIASGIYNGRNAVYVVQLFGRPAFQEEEAELASRRVSKDTNTGTTSSPTSVEEVLGASVTPPENHLETESPNPVVLSESEMFVAVENADFVEIAEESEPARSEVTDRSSFIGKVIASPKLTLKIIYTILGAIVFIVLIIFMAVEKKRYHLKHVFYLALVLLLIFILFYLSSEYLYPAIIIV